MLTCDTCSELPSIISTMSGVQFLTWQTSFRQLIAVIRVADLGCYYADPDRDSTFPVPDSTLKNMHQN